MSSSPRRSSCRSAQPALTHGKPDGNRRLGRRRINRTLVCGSGRVARAVIIGARVAGKADAGEVLVSSTVTDLVAGAGIEFKDRGVHTLKGVPGERRVFAVL